MGRMRYTRFTGDGKDYGHIEGVQASDTMENFTVWFNTRNTFKLYLLILLQHFRKYIAKSWEITDPHLKEFHIHDQNSTCNERGDINPKQWEGLVSVQQDLETDSDTVYCLCFKQKERQGSGSIDFYDSISK